MSTEKDPLLLDHEADGITELDNKLPAWWVWLLWLTVIWSIGYLVHYHWLAIGPSSASEYRAEVQLAAASKRAASSGMAAGAEAEIPLDQVAPSTEAKALARGEALFAKNCIACHASLGQGMIGPNLTDDFWIHGGEFKDIVNTIREGVPAKGMITWKTILKPSEIVDVSSYIWSIHGRDLSNAVPPPKPVEPEAKEYKRPA